MPRLTIFFAVLMMVLGLVAYFGTEQSSWTALIPALFGVVLLVLGIVGLKQDYRQHAMHAAVMVAVAGLAATITGLVELFQLVFKDPKLLTKSTMALLCAVFLILGIKSFIEARLPRWRKKADA